MIQIGRYQLDEEEMVLSCDDQRVLLEPKVFDVLTYFCQHHNRYISMTELHENIWQGRCVSDAAVRRIISKIRILMNDDHKNPTYIQSLPKRGYKLICPVEYDIEDAAESSSVESTAVAITDLSDHNEANNYNEPTEPEEHQDLAEELAGNFVHVVKKPKKFKYTFLSLLMLCICVFGYLAKSWFFPAIVQTQVVNTLPGDKIAVTQSADGSYLAFSGQVHDESGFQIYVKHQSDFDFRPITHHAHLPSSIAFSFDNKSLYFSDTSKINSSLNQIKSDGENREIEILVDNYFLISDVFTARTSNNVFFAAKKSTEGPFLIYEYDVVNKAVTAITASSQAESLDIKGDVSFDGSKLAVLRTNRLSHSDEIRVIDLKTKEVVIRRQHPARVYDVAWGDNNNLLILSRGQLLKINIATSEETLQFANGVKLASLDSIKNRIVSINLGLKEKLFIEKKLPFGELETKRVLKKDIYQMNYFGDKILALLKNHDVTQLGFLDLEADRFDSVIATEYNLAVLDVAPLQGKILVRINRRIALLDPSNIDLQYISSGDDLIGDATFSADNLSILFSTQNYEQWDVNIFNIAKKTTEPFLRDIRYIRPYGESFIIGDSKGELSFFSPSINKKIALNHALSKEPNTQWLVRGDYIYWSSHDLVNTTFHQLNISNLNQPELEVQQFIYNEVKPEFAIDLNNLNFLMSKSESVTSEIVEIPFR